MSRKDLFLVKTILWSLALLVIVAPASLFAQSGEDYDVVLRGGRVMDPETGLDAIRNVGIRGGRIAQISTETLHGRDEIDVSGLVVAPGFIDLHVHGITNEENEYQVHDGVTTALEMELGIYPLADYFRTRAGKALINYGATANWLDARVLAMLGENTRVFDEAMHQLVERGFRGGKLNSLPKELSVLHYQPLPADKLPMMLGLVKVALQEGALGIGLPIGYAPGATREEVFRLYQLAAEYQSPIYTHVRLGSTLYVQQSIADATVSGAPLHVVHINSMALDEIGLAIEMVNEAQSRGFDITTELYPYTAGSTTIESARFDPGWQEEMGISYGDLQWVATGERLTEESFLRYRKQGGYVIIHKMKPAWIQMGVVSANTMIASDGMPYHPQAHPRTAGTFARVLGKYVREEKALSLMEALAKMTLLPARRLEKMAPVMRFKARLQVGCDADITVFDPGKVADKATFEGGLAFSEGISFVLVNGVFVIRDGKTVADTFPGRPVYGKYKN